MWQELPETKQILEYVLRVRKEHAKGLECEDFGEMGQFVNFDLVRSPEFTGPWAKLADQEFRERASSYVRDEVAHHERVQQRAQTAQLYRLKGRPAFRDDILQTRRRDTK
ncbi:MAG TPA: hypothetical protein VJC14_02695 [Candidatus Paceibacterota bacterium]